MCVNRHKSIPLGDDRLNGYNTSLEGKQSVGLSQYTQNIFILAFS